MRITNNMMINNTSANINGNKINVNSLNLQMSSQKKIQRPSENPVIAIRALRLRSTLSQIDQYYEKNIPDARAWLEATETALYNMNKIMTDVKEQCVTGTNAYLTAEDRNTILKSLTALKSQLYSEGNADNAGRTVFTGYRTGSQLTFSEDEQATYKITQSLSYNDIEEYDYFSGSVTIPASVAEATDQTKLEEISKDDFISKSSYDRIRLAYDDIESLMRSDISVKDESGNPVIGFQVRTPIYESEQEWEADGKTVKDYEIVVIKNTGEMILGKGISAEFKSSHATIDVTYQKTGFSQGELRPEYYYNCTDITDAANPIEYTRYDRTTGKKIYEDINYTVALNQNLTINIQADEVFDMSIQQDVVDMIDAVQRAIDAHDKVDKLKEMKSEAKYADPKSQEAMEKWIAAAQKEADYADSNLTKLYSRENGRFDAYMEKLNIAYTEMGTRGDQLEMTEVRISNLQLTQDELKSTNEDKELSDIIIEYTAAFNAYQASLLSASKIEKQTLLDYI